MHQEKNPSPISSDEKINKMFDDDFHPDRAVDSDPAFYETHLKGAPNLKAVAAFLEDSSKIKK